MKVALWRSHSSLKSYLRVKLQINTSQTRRYTHVFHKCKQALWVERDPHRNAWSCAFTLDTPQQRLAKYGPRAVPAVDTTINDSFRKTVLQLQRTGRVSYSLSQPSWQILFLVVRRVPTRRLWRQRYDSYSNSCNDITQLKCIESVLPLIWTPLLLFVYLSSWWCLWILYGGF